LNNRSLDGKYHLSQPTLKITCVYLFYSGIPGFGSFETAFQILARYKQTVQVVWKKLQLAGRGYWII
jgi:hypothetical protein